MAARVYEETVLDGTIGDREVRRLPVRTVLCRGRYWHMKNEHRIMEDYVEPASSFEVWLDTPPEQVP
jgi:hypothetical protein